MAKYSSDNTWKLRRVYVAKVQGRPWQKLCSDNNVFYILYNVYLCLASEIKGSELFLRNKTPARRELGLLGLVYVKVRSTTYAYIAI